MILPKIVYNQHSADKFSKWSKIVTFREKWVFLLFCILHSADVFSKWSKIATFREN
jgi:hypothetical protein